VSRRLELTALGRAPHGLALAALLALLAPALLGPHRLVHLLRATFVLKQSLGQPRALDRQARGLLTAPPVSSLLP
jgi:hypothetical protein